MSEDRERLSDDECLALLDEMFPNGPAGNDILVELAPNRWENSPLIRVFHPTVEQVHGESVRMHERISQLRDMRKKRNPPAEEDEGEPPRPPPTFEETVANFNEAPVETEKELRELLGLCLWQIFSDSHEVIAATGRLADLGSFRGSAGFIADWVNRQANTTEYDYMHFYMGPWLLADRADLQPVYELIFRRLQKAGADWEYHFPQLYLVKLPNADELPETEKPAEWESYSPSEAVAEDQKEREEEAEQETLAEEIDQINAESKNAAMDRPPPKVVNAYINVFGREPKGWPPLPNDAP